MEEKGIVFFSRLHLVSNYHTMIVITIDWEAAYQVICSIGMSSTARKNYHLIREAFPIILIPARICRSCYYRP